MTSAIAPGSPRIPPLSPKAFTDEQAAVAQGREALNLARVFVQHPALYRAFTPFAEQLFQGSSLPPREREILILRALELCDEGYGLPHHVIIAQTIGMTDADIAAARQGGPTLSPFEQALAKAAEELVRAHRIGDETWHELAQRYSVTQLMEVVFLVGIYVMMATATKSFGIQLEDDPGRALNPDS
jgi:4-carboxymuconolactone decarboxylase